LFVWFANLAAFFCAWSNGFIWPSLYGSQHKAPYSGNWMHKWRVR
jgi:hypothetical protein